MSTFGKKALIWWNYYDHDGSMRFNHTPKDMQLKILEKWYPVGMKCLYWDYYDKKTTGNILTIEKYSDQQYFYQLELSSEKNANPSFRILNSGVISSPKITNKFHNPLRVVPTDEWLKMVKRENKINRLFD